MVRRLEPFCGCCELKVGCIVVAVCRVVITVAASLALFVSYLNIEFKENILQHVSESELAFYMIISIPVSIITIRCAYWFIQGATTVDQVKIDRMSHYYMIQFATIIVLIACFNSYCFFLATIEFHFTYCSVLLAKQRKRLVEENALNDSGVPPPQYESCVNDTQPKISAIHVDEAQSLKNSGNEPFINSFNNAGVETKENPLEKARVEGYPFENRESEPKENLGLMTEENAGQEPDEKVIQNVTMAHEDNSLKNVEGEGKENSVEFESKENPMKESGFNINNEIQAKVLRVLN